MKIIVEVFNTFSEAMKIGIEVFNMFGVSPRNAMKIYENRYVLCSCSCHGCPGRSQFPFVHRSSYAHSWRVQIFRSRFGMTKITATWDKTSTQKTGTHQGYVTTMVVAKCFGVLRVRPLLDFTSEILHPVLEHHPRAIFAALRKHNVRSDTVPVGISSDEGTTFVHVWNRMETANISRW